MSRVSRLSRVLRVSLLSRRWRAVRPARRMHPGRPLPPVPPVRPAQRGRPSGPRLLRAIACASGLVLVAAPAAALDPAKAITQYVHDVWQAKDGFRQHAVRAIAQTPEGYVWLATQAGLVRFDGIRFTVFDVANTPGLRGAIVMSLIVARDGTLWIATDGGGLSRFKDGKFSSYTTREGLAQEFLWSLHEARDGSLWIGTGGAGVNHFKDGKVLRERWPVGHVAALLEDRDGSVWIGTTTGLLRLQQGRTQRYTVADGLGDNTIRALWQDREGTLWIGTTRGLSRLRHGVLHTFTTRDGLRSDSIRALFEDRHGTLWIGTLDGGLARIRDGRIETFTSQDGLSDNSVLALFEDREGSLWIGTRNGLNRLRDGPLTTFTTKDGLPTDAVRTIVAARDGSIWIATDGAGLARLEPGPGAGRRVTTFSRRNGLPDDHLRSIVEARDGSIWVTAVDQALARVQDGRVTSYRVPTRLAGIGADAGGILLGVAPGGIARFAGGVLGPRDRVQGRDPHVYAMFRDRSGRQWLATNDGLWRSDGTSGEHAGGGWTQFSTRDGLPDKEVYALHEDAEGILWVATRGGLARWHQDRWKTFTTRDGLFDDILFHVLEDRHGNLWMNASRGIFRVRRDDLNAFAEGRLPRVTCVAYDTTDGMKTAESSAHMQPAAARAPDGRLWFATDKGVVMVDPDNLPTNALVPAVIIERLVADGQGVGLDAGAVRLAAGAKRLDFHYTALSLLVPQKVRFKYRLEGYDEDWVDAGAQRIATYANLPPGSYTFRVMASNNDGVWNRTGAAVGFALAPHFHQTPYFFGLIGVSAIAIAWGVYRVRVRYLQAQFALVLAERNRLAREFHDTLEAGFVGITLQLDVAAAKLRESPDLASAHLTLARTMVLHSMGEARRSVWDLRSHALEHGDLATALAQVARDLNADGMMQTDVRVVGTPTRLSAVAENGLFRIGQEAITNAFKHARAATLTVELQFERDRLRLRVQDDGQGFVAPAPAPTSTSGGFGLLGMRERANKLRAQLTLRTDPGKGTEVIVDVPLVLG